MILNSVSAKAEKPNKHKINAKNFMAEIPDL
jgi:hypothetical protein